MFMRVNSLAMTYEKMKVKALNHHTHTVDLVKGNRRPTRRSFYPKYTEVVFVSVFDVGLNALLMWVE